MRVLAIDPGYERLGYAVLDGEILVESGCIKTKKEEDFNDRLLLIGTAIREIIEKRGPEAFAIEDLFFNTNQKTAMRVAGVRGALIHIAMENGLKVFEYTPLQIKIAMTGYGRSPKEQVIEMVRRLVKIEKEVKYDDEYDAIAVGLTCVASDAR